MDKGLIDLIDTSLNITLFISILLFVYYFKSEYVQLWKTKNFKKHSTLSSMSTCLALNLLFFLLFSYVKSSLYLLDMSQESRWCLFYTSNSIIFLAYIYSHIQIHSLLKIPLHSMAKMCCIIGTFLIFVQVARFTDRLIVKTDILSFFYFLSNYLANALIILTIIFSFTYVMFAAHQIKKENKDYGRLQ